MIDRLQAIEPRFLAQLKFIDPLEGARLDLLGGSDRLPSQHVLADEHFEYPAGISIECHFVGTIAPIWLGFYPQLYGHGIGNAVFVN